MNFSDNELNSLLPSRRRLPHRPPVSVSSRTINAFYFVTVCVSRQEYNIKDQDAGRVGPIVGSTAQEVIKAIDFYDERGDIKLICALAMPDHVHFIAQFASESEILNFVSKWKRWTAKKLSIIWQTDFFEHRLRSEEEMVEKVHYIEGNPVRKNLCVEADEWPYKITKPRFR